MKTLFFLSVWSVVALMLWALVIAGMPWYGVLLVVLGLLVLVHLLIGIKP